MNRYLDTFNVSFNLNVAAMIHWTRQIKELLNNQDAHETSENAGPLEEIAFWRGRCNDLLGISDQLDKPGVKQIVSVLTIAKSSYVGPFLKLSKLIQVSMLQCLLHKTPWPCLAYCIFHLALLMC